MQVRPLYFRETCNSLPHFSLPFEPRPRQQDTAAPTGPSSSIHNHGKSHNISARPSAWKFHHHSRMRICSCALSSPARAFDGWRFAENFRCWPHYWTVPWVGDEEGEATITSSATAKIRMIYSSIRNNGLLYFAIGIWDAMYLHHAPESAGRQID